MIEANRNVSFEKIFHLYNKRLLKKSFHQLMITNDSFMPSNNNGIYVINHSSWWDPLMLFYLNQSLLQLDAIAMMDEEGINRFPFFRKLGAFSINSQSSRSFIESLNYSSRQLESGKHLFLFPQGEERHLEQRPLSFFTGAVYLQEQNPSVPIIPITFYHGLFHYQFPEWYIHVGQPLFLSEEGSRRAKTDYLEKISESLLDNLKARVITDDSLQFRILLEGTKGIGQSWESLKKRFKGEKR